MDSGRIFSLRSLTACFSFVLLITVIDDSSAAAAAAAAAGGDATPVFVSEPQNITTLQGQSIRFVCRVQNLQSWQQLMWRHKNGDRDMMVALSNRLLVIGGERSIVQEEDGSVSILGLQSAATDQEGDYLCVISGTDQEQVNHLTVNVPATIVATEPRGTSLNVLQGRPLYLSCTVEGKPEPVITWTKQGRQPFVGESLALAETRKENSGLYTCVADNGAGDPTSRHFNINVQYEPRVEVLTPIVRVGLHKRATLECIFDSNPPIGQVTWSKDDEPIDAGNDFIPSREDGDGGHVVARLQIVSVNPSDVGSYSCTGDNGLGPTSDVISLSGLPYDLQLTTSDHRSRFSDQFTVRWSVRSESVLQETEIILDKDEEEEEDVTNSSELYSNRKQFSVRMTSADQQQHPVYNLDFVLKQLRPSSGYKLTLRVRNAFGFTNWTDELHFVTADEGNEAPLSTTLGTTQIKVNLPDDNDARSRYTHRPIRNEAHGAGSLESSSSSFFLYSFASLRTLPFISIISEVLCWILIR